MPERSTKIEALNVAKVAVWFVYAVVVAYVVILALAFFLLLLGANPTADFVDWIYNAAGRIMQPFRGIFPSVHVSGKSVFEPSLLFAIIIYTLFAVVVRSLFDWLDVRGSRLRAERERDRYYAAMGGAPAAQPAPAPPAPGGPVGG